MKKITLNIQERFGIRNMLNAVYQKGGLSLDMLKDSLKINKNIAIEVMFPEKPDKDGVYKATAGEEAKAVDMIQRITPQGGNISWNSEKDKGKEFEFSEDEMKLITEIIKGKNDKKEITMEDSYLIELAPKLGMTI